jgi:class 3 adenylate cyclase
MGMNHQLGQYRAELFDELVARLLAAMYPQANVTRKTTLRVPHKGAFRSVSIDFRVGIPSGDIVVETKAPYTDAVADVINSALRGLKTVVELLSPGRIKTFTLAIPTPFPQASCALLEEIRHVASERGATVKVWDGEELLKLVREHLSADISSFETIDELKKALGTESVAGPPDVPLVGLNEGLNDGVVILIADFCSFSRFVQASGTDTALITSVMARFYRETRQAIKEDGGEVDKYMGDAMLAYWLGEDAGARLERCVQRLMGIAVNLAEEWQDQIDYAVEPKGLRAGAAIGSVLFVSEQPPSPSSHAIGDAVNIAARLQGEAEPNSLMISNRLRKRFFGARDDFEEVGPFNLKNIGKVIAWRKTFGKNGV